MTRKHFGIIGLCVISIPLLLGALYLSSPLNAEIYRGDFKRRVKPNVALEREAVIDLEYNSYYIAGIAGNTIYLGNSTTPFSLRTIDLSTNESLNLEIKIAGLDSIMEPRRCKVSIDSPHFYVYNGIMPQILRGRIGTWVAKPIMKDNGYFFVEATPISPHAFALRSYSGSTRAFSLAKKTTGPPYFEFRHGLLQKQMDGIFCLEGTIHYAKENNLLVYVHTYRNEIILADTNLNLVLRGKTIDSFNKAHIDSRTLASGTKTLLASPPLEVNKHSLVWKDKLYVQSNVMAANDDEGQFRNSAVLDIYRITDATYLESIYLDDYHGLKARDVSISGNIITMIYDQYLIINQITNSLEPVKHQE